MEFLALNFLWIIGGLTLAVIGLIIAHIVRISALKQQVYKATIEMEAAANYAAELRKQIDRLQALEDINDDYLEAKSIAQTEKREIEKQFLALQQEAYHLRNARELSEAQRLEAEKQTALALQKIADWQVLKVQMEEHSRAAMMKTSSDISSKLLEDHKRESEAQKKQVEEQTQKTTEAMFEQMKILAERVASLNEKTDGNDTKLGNMIRLLSTPGGAGQLSEIGLENSLKNLGLERGRDFIMQYRVNDGELRPDCVIFLPQNSVLVIDSKSSKLIGEFAHTETSATEIDFLEKLAQSMNRHLKDLSSRNYEAAIREDFAKAGRGNHISLIWNIMYLPSESLVEKLHAADPLFKEKCEKLRITVAGPSGLHSHLMMAGYNIDIARQSEDIDRIISAMREVMEGFAVSLSHLLKVGKHLKTTVNGYDSFTRHANRHLLPKLLNLTSYGIKPVKGKDIPAQLPSFEVRSSDDLLTVDAEVEESVKLVKSEA